MASEDEYADATAPETLRVAAMGGATGWSAAEAVLAKLPACPGFAVIALAEATDIRPVVERLQAASQIAVVAARDGVDLDIDHVYVVPRSHDAIVQRGRLRLVTPSASPRAPLDRVLRSLADDVGGHATGIVLSGPGVDGSIGAKRLKEAGGLVIVQAPSDAVHGEMPRAAIATGIADLVLPAAEIAGRLVDLATAPALALGEDDHGEALVSADGLRDVLTLVRVRSGHDFAGYKRATLLRRIARRVQVARCDGVGQYLTYLRERPDELETLLRDFLISVTNFFRDPDAFAVLRTQVVPQLFADKRPQDQVRVWVPGCATGEEAYSIAMLLDEHAHRLADPPAIQVFATDIDEEALAEARSARYPDTIAADVSPLQLDRHFVNDSGLYRLRKELREIVLFSPHNLLRDPPFSRLDLVSCRNLLIYLNRDAQDRVLRIFHFALRPGGHMFLGSSESAESQSGWFSAVDAKHRIYLRRTVPSSLQVDSILPAGRRQATTPAPAKDDLRERRLGVGELHHRVVELYGPPSVLVDEELEILHVSEHAGRYLTVAGGEPTRQLTRLIHPGLQLDLRAAVHAARQPDADGTSRLVRYTDDGTERVVELVVHAVELKDLGRVVLLVRFADQAHDAAKPPLPLAGPVDAAIEPVVRQLEDELYRTRDHLRGTIEQYETSVEELKASNEELHAINEELRSTSEELETGKEELQSVNEELTTLNHELKGRVDELRRVNGDLQNLMTSTDIGVVFLDRDLNIKRFTDRARDLFNVIGSDIGRPLAHLTHRLDVHDLAESAALVLQTLRTIERAVRAKDGRRYLARLLPYRSLDDRIEGVVLTFVDVTDLRRAEDALRERDALLRIAERAGGAGFWELHIARREFRMSEECTRLHGLAAAGPIDLVALTAQVHIADRGTVTAALEAAIEHGADLDVEYRVAQASGERWLWSLGRVLGSAGGGELISGISVDVTGPTGGRRARSD